ncbi:RpiB/LacA/LacB family sugar-phosphate isomerase [Streptomyces sp. TM32]|uniref:RpiB/LacA/LacB family sugar-phosphate isomerase n=1 Tax=Streptomyces sp. TM32 TaxID=1652669 RepID=UPI0010122A2E|nr:RpiB/LacA/LacB family sugar-phosphate isomerase [Streptomyces sp. TM32]RXS72039.1 RpiB/LacA/LacB family sugar-phosphate isomerase [Streptomyces sp. TM32]
MIISISADWDEPLARMLATELKDRGHSVLPHGVLKEGDRTDWSYASQAAAEDVAAGRAAFGVVCCWTGTGASLAANKVRGVRAALCHDAYTAAGARCFNDANVLAISLRLTSGPVLREMLEAWFNTPASQASDDVANIARIHQLDNALGTT